MLWVPRNSKWSCPWDEAAHLECRSRAVAGSVSRVVCVTGEGLAAEGETSGLTGWGRPPLQTLGFERLPPLLSLPSPSRGAPDGEDRPVQMFVLLAWWLRVSSRSPPRARHFSLLFTWSLCPWPSTPFQDSFSLPSCEYRLLLIKDPSVHGWEANPSHPSRFLVVGFLFSFNFCSGFSVCSKE